jgi:hypothetical protein
MRRSTPAGAATALLDGWTAQKTGAHDLGAGVATAVGWGLPATAPGGGADLAFPRFDARQPNVA